jgi:hypothetical protein
LRMCLNVVFNSRILDGRASLNLKLQDGHLLQYNLRGRKKLSH